MIAPRLLSAAAAAAAAAVAAAARTAYARGILAHRRPPVVIERERDSKCWVEVSTFWFLGQPLLYFEEIHLVSTKTYILEEDVRLY